SVDVPPIVILLAVPVKVFNLASVYVVDILEPCHTPVPIVPTITMVFWPAYDALISTMGSVAVPLIVVRLRTPVNVFNLASVYVVLIEEPCQTPVLIVPTITIVFWPA